MNRRREKTEDPSSARRREVSLSALPPETLQAISRGVFGVRARWSVLSAFSAADPGRRIAAIRELRHLSQAQLAEKAGVRQSDVSKAENRFREVKFGIIERIAGALDTAIEEFLVAGSEIDEDVLASQTED